MRQFKQSLNKSRGKLAIGRMGFAVLLLGMFSGGVSYALLQAVPVTVSGSVIQTTTANLAIGQNGTQYGASLTGFQFSNVVPGGQSMPLSGYPVYIKNTGGAPLLLKFSVARTPSNPDNVDLSKVNIILTPIGGGSPQTFTLAALVAAHATGGLAVNTPLQLPAGQAQQYTLQVSMLSDAVSSGGATIGDIDFAFSGIVPAS